MNLTTFAPNFKTEDLIPLFVKNTHTFVEKTKTNHNKL